ncbi:hypothetical protein ACFLSW_02905 [Candidatus Bipolaricaulota bacterium]
MSCARRCNWLLRLFVLLLSVMALAASSVIANDSSNPYMETSAAAVLMVTLLEIMQAQAEINLANTEVSLRAMELIQSLGFNTAAKLREAAFMRAVRSWAQAISQYLLAASSSGSEPDPIKIVRLGSPQAGNPQEADEPHILVEEFAISDLDSGMSSQYEALVVLRNVGLASYVGPYMLSAGLAYSRSWVPESLTVFDAHIGQIELLPGAKLTLILPIAEIPAMLHEVFRLYLAVVWTGYEDSDPLDYVGFMLDLDVDGFPKCIGFEPIQ